MNRSTGAAVAVVVAGFLLLTVMPLLGSVVVPQAQSGGDPVADTPASTPAGTSPTPTPGRSPTRTPAPTPAPTATPTPTPTAAPTTASLSLSTEADWQTLLESHERTLRSASSFTVRQAVDGEGPDAALSDTEQRARLTYVANDGERYQRVVLPTRRVARYQPDDGEPVHVRYNRSGRVRTTTTSGPIDLESAIRPVEASWLASFNYTDHGIVSTPRGDRRKLTVTSVEDVGSTVTDSLEGELVGIDYRILIDPEREVITRVAYTVELERDAGTVTLSVRVVTTGIGSSDPERPSWVEGTATPSN